MAFTKEEAAAVKTAAALIKRELVAGEEVAVHLFGSFKPKHKPARTGRSPATGEEIQIAAKTVVAFKPSKALLG